MHFTATQKRKENVDDLRTAGEDQSQTEADFFLLARQSLAGTVSCVCSHSREPVLASPSSFAHIETYIEEGTCLQTAFQVHDPWLAVYYERRVALETFSAVGMVRKTKNVFITNECPNTFPGPIHCNTGPCVHGFCHSSNFDKGKPQWCICNPGYTGQECDTKQVCSRSMISLAGRCYDLYNNRLLHNNYSHVPGFGFAGTMYPLNEDCVVSTSTDSSVRGVYCHCGHNQALLFSNRSEPMCGCDGGQLKKLDGTCTDMNLCMLSDYCVHGTCLNTTLIPTCMCDSGYTGLRCDTKIVSQTTNICNGKACVHGVCADTWCLCDMGWKGVSCDILATCGKDSFSLLSGCVSYKHRFNNDPCVSSSVCPYCYKYPYTKSGVVCGSEGSAYKLIDGSVVQPVDKEHAIACFPATSFVYGRKNITISMKDLRVGDEIVTVDDQGNYKYTKVILMMHNDGKQKLNYRKLTTSSGASIDISREHLMYVRNDNRQVSVKTAGDVQVGDTIFVFNNYLGETEASHVVSITEEEKFGLYAPLTESGNLVVDNHFVSSYATYENQDLVHALFWPWRMAYKLSTLIYGDEPYAPEERDAHWSLKGLFMFANLRCYLFNEDYCKYVH